MLWLLTGPRVRHSAALVVVVLLCSSATPAGAQTAAADGVQAIVRGDYQTALRILTPLAEDSTQPDALAQFFLAAIYDAGAGVPRNMMRACGLYSSAGDGATPFAALARDIADTMFDPSVIRNRRMVICPPATTHPWGDPLPATFKLDDVQTLHVDGNGIVITVDGVPHRVHTTIGAPGAVYLPTRYTALDVLGPSPRRRHFIEWFIWRRDDPAGSATWSLAWLLQEVVDADLRTIAHDESLTTSTAQQPPTNIDLTRAVVLRVNSDGDAEWVVPDPAAPRGGIIPDAPR